MFVICGSIDIKYTLSFLSPKRQSALIAMAGPLVKAAFTAQHVTRYMRGVMGNFGFSSATALACRVAASGNFVVQNHFVKVVEILGNGSA